MSDIRKAHSNVVVLPRVAPASNYRHSIRADEGYVEGSDGDCNDRENGPPLDDQPEDHMRAKVEHMRHWRSARTSRED